jgi:hypothetical protein
MSYSIDKFKTPLILASLIIIEVLLVPIAMAEKSREDSWYFLWGYNRSFYSESDIDFRGKLNGVDYQFTLDNVAAEDGPVNFGAVYFDTRKWLIPQYNYRFGYHLDDHHVVSFGMDHMKFIMNQDQTVNIQGTTVENASLKSYAPGSTRTLTEDFLMYEHADGLNYFSLDLETYDPFWSNDKIAVKTMWGIGAGFVIPKSNVKLFDGQRNDEFHFAGLGVSAKVAVQMEFLEDYFLRFTIKKGYLNLDDVLTTSGSNNKARQDFEFNQLIFSGGLYY